jgi:parallel beta-helix repeat protein
MTACNFIKALLRGTTLTSILGILLLLSHTAQAQLPPPTAADTASHSAYDPPLPEWTTGDNGGFGMGPWTLNPASNTPQNGFFVGDSTGNNGTSGDTNGDGDINTIPGPRAWGLYADSGQTASAVRDFNLPFTPGSVFEIFMDNGDVQAGGKVGFALQNSSGQDLLEVYFVGDDTQYIVHGSTPISSSSSVSFTREGVRVVITLTTASTYQATLTRLVDGAGDTVSGTLRNNPGPISRLRLFNINAGASPSNDVFFNRITYYRGRVLNTDTGRGYLDIQPAINDPATLAGHTISVSAGLYTGTQNNNIVINKPRLTLIGAGPTATVISRTASGTLRGIEIAPSITGTTISSLRVQGFNDGGICAIQNNHFTTITNTHVYSNTAGGNCLGGIYMNGPVNHVLISHNEAVNNTSRGIVIWNGFKTNITITHNLVRNNNCCGIELQDGTASGVLIAHNTVRDNFDNGIGTVGLTAGAGPNLIYSNTLINNGRFGIEVKLPNGSGLPSGDGSIVVLSNTVALTDTIANIKSGEQRDLAGIAAFRRAWVAGFNNVDIPAGVIIQGNVVSGYQQPSASDGFGIVVEGARMTVISNTLENNDVGVQVQAGHTPYAPFTNTDGDQSNLADQYFGRGNSPVACAFYQAGNVFTGNLTNTRQVGTVTPGTVSNLNTSQTFCGIQQAIDAPPTLGGHVLSLTGDTFTGTVIARKPVAIAGAGPGQTIIQSLSPGIVVTTSNVTISNTSIVGTGSDVGITTTFGVTNLTVSNVHISNFAQGVALLGGHSHSVQNSVFTLTNVITSVGVGMTGLTTTLPITNVLVSGNVFTNSGYAVVGIFADQNVITGNQMRFGTAGVRLAGANGNLIEGNQIENNSSYAIYLAPDAPPLIPSPVLSNSNNVISGNVALNHPNDRAIQIINSPQPGNGNQIVNNVVQNAGQAGILTGLGSGDTNLLIAGNTVITANPGIVVGSSVTATITNNQVSGGSIGIRVANSSIVTVISNTTSNNGDGISVESGSSHVTVTNNAASSANNGFRITNSSAVTVTANQATNSTTGFFVDNGSNAVALFNNQAQSLNTGVRVGSGATNVTLASNTVDGTALSLELQNSSHVVITGNTLINSGLGFSITNGAGNLVTATFNVITSTGGVLFNSGNASGLLLRRNNLANNTGVTNTAAGTLNAECNWYGAANGPSGVGNGSGTPVSTGVDFNPWLLSDDLNGPCSGGSLTVQKVLVGPITPTTAWQFTATVPTGTLVFTLPAGGGAVTFSGLDFGPATITETTKLGYIPTSSCTTGATGGASISFNLIGDATCTFTNTLEAPTAITLTAIPTTAVVGSSVLLTATVTISDGTPAADGTVVTFTASLGSISPLTATTIGGVVTATLNSTVASVAAVTATVNSLSATALVTFTPGAPFTLTLTAVPATLPVGNSSTLTATATDQYGNPVADGTTISFTTSLGALSSSTANTSGGDAIVTLSSTVAGVATVTATIGSLSATAQVTFARVFNMNTGLGYVGIQQAIDDPQTLNGHTISVTAGIYTELVSVTKQLTLLGAQHGQDAVARTAAFVGGKADPTVESIIYTPINNPTGGNPGAADLFRVLTHNVTIDGFVFDGNNPALLTSTVQIEGVYAHARRGVTNIGPNDSFNPLNNLVLRNNVFQNFGQRGVSLANNGPLSVGNLIERNVLRRIRDQAIILFTNAYADIVSNTVKVPVGGIGLHLQNFSANNSMAWLSNTVTIITNAFGIHANLFYAPSATLLIRGNMVNADAASALPSQAVRGWGINVWSIQQGSTVIVEGNRVGLSGGRLGRGINVWNVPTNNTVRVTSNAVANSTVGVNFDNVDLYFGGGQSSTLLVTSNTITGTADGVGLRVRVSVLESDPLFGANAVSGHGLMLISDTTVVSAGVGLRVETGITSTFMASATLHNSTLRNNGIGIQVLRGALTATHNYLLTNTLGVTNTGGASVDVWLNRNAIVGNGAGITNTAAGMLKAECNWYGAANGPSGVGNGSGDSVSSGVDFNPWLLSDNLNGPCSGGSLTIQKVLVGPITPITAWQFTATVPTGTLVFTLPAGGGAITFSGLDFGPATITETPKLGYSATSSCTTGATGAASISFNLIGDATCTFTNTLEAPTAITLTAIPTTAVVGSSVLLTATVTISDGTPAADGTVVTFTASLGSISPLTATTIGGVVTATLNSTVASVAAVTATVNSLSATALVTFTPGAPFTLTLTAVPATLPVGNSSTLTATATDQYGNPVADGTTISFTTSLGALSSSTANTSGGDAIVTLSSTVAGVATVTATIGSLSATAQVTFARVFNMNTGLGYVGIQQAIDDPQTLNGHTISVTAGIYTELVSVTKQLTLLGAQHGQDALARTAAFVGGKADSTLESIIYTPINNPTGGNPGAADLFRVLTHNVTIDGFVFDGNNPALLTSTVQIEGVDAHARRGVTNIGPDDSFNPLNNLILRNNVFQNFGDRGVSLDNNGPVSTGNLIERNVLRRIYNRAIILVRNAYADVVSNTIDVPVEGVGLWMQTFYSDGSMAWLSNTVTIMTDAFGIHVNNLFNALSATIVIRGNVVNAAASVAPEDADLTWGINVWSVFAGWGVLVEENRVGLSGGRLGRGINVWNVPTTNTVRVLGNIVANSTVGINFDNVDPYYGGGQSSTLLVTGNTITGTADGIGLRVRVSVLESDPLYASNVVSGHGLMVISNTTVASASVGLRVETGITSTFMASATLHNSALRNNGIGIQVLRGALTATHNYLLTNTLGVTNTGGASVDVWLNRNAIVGNGAGITNTAAGTLNAECNWYGAVSGPSGVGSGSGDSVSTGVDFNPWLLSDDLNGPCSGGSLTIQKVLVGPITPTTAWQFTATVPTGTLVFTLPAGGGAVTFGSLDFGPVTITETPKLGYIATSSCTTGATGGASIAFSLLGDVTCIFTNTLAVPTTITLSADPSSAVVNSSVLLTATVSDQFGNPVTDGTVVSFTTSLGNVSPVTATTVGGVVTATLNSTVAGVATVTATVGSLSATAQVTFTPGAPFTLTLTAVPATLPVGNSSTLTATATDQFGNPVADGTTISFTTSLGTLSSATATTSGGNASVTLNSTLPGVATVTATVGSLNATTLVTFTPGAPFTFTFTLTPTVIVANGISQSLATATVVDQFGNPVSGVTVNFLAGIGTFSPASGATNASGQITATLTSLTPAIENVFAAISGLGFRSVQVIYVNPPASSAPLTSTLQTVTQTLGVVRKGGFITYTLVVTNSGLGQVNNVLIYAPIPSGTTYVAGSASGGNFSGSFAMLLTGQELGEGTFGPQATLNAVTWSGNLAAGASHTLSYVVQAQILEGQVVNQPKVFVDNADTGMNLSSAVDVVAYKIYVPIVRRQ